MPFSVFFQVQRTGSSPRNRGESLARWAERAQRGLVPQGVALRWKNGCSVGAWSGTVRARRGQVHFSAAVFRQMSIFSPKNGPVPSLCPACGTAHGNARRPARLAAGRVNRRDLSRSERSLVPIQKYTNSQKACQEESSKSSQNICTDKELGAKVFSQIAPGGAAKPRFLRTRGERHRRPSPSHVSGTSQAHRAHVHLLIVIATQPYRELEFQPPK
jgi:hypothetical protein